MIFLLLKDLLGRRDSKSRKQKAVSRVGGRNKERRRAMGD